MKKLTLLALATTIFTLSHAQGQPPQTNQPVTQEQLSQVIQRVEAAEAVSAKNTKDNAINAKEIKIQKAKMKAVETALSGRINVVTDNLSDLDTRTDSRFQTTNTNYAVMKDSLKGTRSYMYNVEKNTNNQITDLVNNKAGKGSIRLIWIISIIAIIAALLAFVVSWMIKRSVKSEMASAARKSRSGTTTTTPGNGSTL